MSKEEVLEFLKDRIIDDLPKEDKKEFLKEIKEFKKEIKDYDETMKLAKNIAEIINKKENKCLTLDVFLTFLRKEVRIVSRDKLGIFMSQVLEEHSSVTKATDEMTELYLKQKEPEAKFIG